MFNDENPKRKETQNKRSYIQVPEFSIPQFNSGSRTCCLDRPVKNYYAFAMAI